MNTDNSNVTEQERQMELNRQFVVNAFKEKAKLEALRFAPSSKTLNGLAASGGIPYQTPMTAKEIVVAAEEIYQWLIKDLQP